MKSHRGHDKIKGARIRRGNILAISICHLAGHLVSDVLTIGVSGPTILRRKRNLDAKQAIEEFLAKAKHNSPGFLLDEYDDPSNYKAERRFSHQQSLKTYKLMHYEP